MSEQNEVWFTVLLDGDRPYGRGGIRLSPGVQERTVDKAIDLFRQLREKFRPDLEAAMAPPEGWPWTEVIVARLPVKLLMEYVSPEEAKQVAFPIQKEFSGYDSSGKTLGDVLSENPGLLSWLAYEAMKKEVDIDSQYPKMKLAVAGARVLVKMLVDEKLKGEDF